MGHAIKFAAGQIKVSRHAIVLGKLAFGQVNQIGHGFQRVVDFMRNGGGHASGGGKLFCGPQSPLDFIGFCNVANDLGRANHVPIVIFYW
jgi:hypothetical protein